MKEDGVSGGPSERFHIPNGARLTMASLGQLIASTTRRLRLPSKQVAPGLVHNVTTPLMVTGWADGPDSPIVFYNPGFDGKFTKAELTAMMVHELGHWQLRHMAARSELSDLAGPITQWTAESLAICRRQELEADRWAAENGFGRQLASALEKIQQPGFVESALYGAAIENNRRAVEELRALGIGKTHPSLDHRIQVLRGLAANDISLG